MGCRKIIGNTKACYRIRLKIFEKNGVCNFRLFSISIMTKKFDILITISRALHKTIKRFAILCFDSERSSSILFLFEDDKVHLVLQIIFYYDFDVLHNMFRLYLNRVEMVFIIFYYILGEVRQVLVGDEMMALASFKIK